MLQKGKHTWVFGLLSFVAVIHAVEAFIAVFFEKEIVLLKLYPFIGSINVNTLSYLMVTLIGASVLIAVTFRLAFSSPLENYLNLIVAEAKKTSQEEDEMVDENRPILDMMYESIDYLSNLVGQTKDLTHNVKSELVSLRSVPQKTEKLSVEIKQVKNELSKLKQSLKKSKSCPSCNRDVLDNFKICPYCGEALLLSPEKVIIKKM
jgi:methyl-accepting chemotaxis protein